MIVIIGSTRSSTIYIKFTTKCDVCYYKVRQLAFLESAMVCYYKVRQLAFLESAMVCYYKVRQLFHIKLQ